MNDDNRSFILAILLSIAVLVGWNAFIAAPRIQEEQERLKQQQQAEKSGQIPGTTSTQSDTPKITQDTTGTLGQPLRSGLGR